MNLSVDIRHSFSGFILNAAFDVPNGITGLIGPSGSGKTTLINAIAGILRPDHGRINLGECQFFNERIGTCLTPQARKVGYVFQDYRLFPHLNVAKNLDYGRWIRGLPNDTAKRSRTVELLGLEHLLGRRIGSLSGGEKARVGIARALLSNPQLLLMDEPLAALDADRKKEILPYLERLRDEAELPIIYVSHALDEVIRLATSLVIMKDGNVEMSGAAKDVICNADSATFLGADAVGALLSGTPTGLVADGLSEITVSSAKIWVPEISGDPSRKLRIRVRANDIILSRKPPEGLSALNVLPAKVTRISGGMDAARMVQLSVGDELMLAQLTARSVHALELDKGTDCFAILKSVAVSHNDIGGG